MVRKPARMYTRIKGQAYTRRKYMGGVPMNRIQHFEIGPVNGDFPITLTLIAEEACQIRHTALEAARVSATRKLTATLGNNGFFLKVRVYPHHVLRENKQATGAGADRVSMGMRLSFGKAVGTAARVQIGQKIMSVKTNKNGFPAAKEAMLNASYKLPTPTRLIVESGQELIQK